MKRIFPFLVFSFTFVWSAFAQKESVLGISGSIPVPPPLATSTVVTCGTLTLSISGTDPKCNAAADGSASVVVSGGTVPYTYLWSPSNATTSTVTGLVGNTYVIEVWDNNLNYCSGSIALVNPASLIINITPPAPVSSCFGYCDGSATASPTGGTAPYSYSWNTVPAQSTALATGLCSQVYNITMTDGNGCVKVKPVSIGQPAPLAAIGSSASITCFGFCNGTASVNPSGGNPPYTYSWNTGSTTSSIAALCPGNYTCTVRDSKICVDTYITAISEPSALTVTVTGNNLVCNTVCTGSVSATASGGTGTYTYSWMPGGYATSAVTGLCAGTYTLTLWDANSCSKTSTITLTQPTSVTAVTSGQNVKCFNQCDGSVSVTAGGGTPPYSYLWMLGGCTTSACSNLCNATYTVTVTDISGCTVTATQTLSQPVLLTATPTKTDATCFGACNGSVSAVAAGGTAPYTYSWLPGGCTTSACAGLCTGDYSVTVTDAKGCTATSSITVSSPPAIVPTLSSTNALCFGNCNGTATSNTSGGISPYTYNWSGGCTTSSCSGLCASNYSVTVSDAIGCTVTATISVGQPGLFTASIASASPNPLNCSGDCNATVLANLNGGTPIYSYAWTNGGTAASITGMCAGGYTLTATDANGCTAATSVTLTAPPALTVAIAQTNASCSGGCNGSIAATPGGGTVPYTYFWQPGNQTTSSITGQCAGDYTITVFDNKGCFSTQTITLTAPSAVAPNVSVVKDVSCSGACDGVATANPTGGTGAYTYIWSGGSGTTQTVSNLCAGNHNVLVQDANGCAGPLGNVTITQPSTLLSIVSSVTSSCNMCVGSASITTVGGTFPYTYSWSPGGQTAATATGLCIGNYTVTITDANNCANTVTLAVTSTINVAITSSGPGVSCPGSCDGSAAATPSGGISPYTYSWNSAPVQTAQTATGLCAGSYTVTVTDTPGCIAAKAVSFSSPPAFIITLSSTPASCGFCDGTASVAASGGTGTLTYSWSGFPMQTTSAATGLCPGDYTVTVSDANNCTNTATVSVGNIPVISDNPSITLSTCAGSDGAICVAPTGGTPGYTYLWAPGGSTVSCVTGLAAGIYTVTISDNAGCSLPFQIALGAVTGPTLTVTSSNPPSCNAGCDGAIAVSAAGNPPFTYFWNPGGQTTTSVSGLCAGTYIVQVDDNVPCPSFASTTLSNPPQLSGNPTITNVSCKSGNNGSICLSPSGGTSPYTYKWLPGNQTTSCLNALTAGTYSVVISDSKGCDDTLAIPVSEPALLTVSISATGITCNGSNNGTATAVATGGTALYTYAWSNGSPLPAIAGLASGGYTVTVTDKNLCTATATVMITEPAALTSTITSTSITCNSACNGMASLTASGGTASYSFAWQPNGETTSAISALCPGNYQGIITDANGCASSQTVLITEPAAITTTVTPSGATCFGGCNGSASAGSGGGTGAYTYSWNPGALTGSPATGLCVNSYTLTTADANGCAITTLFSVSAPAALQPNITQTQTSCVNTCDGTAISSPVGGTGAYTFLWSNGQTTSTATGLCAGTATLTLSDANGCSIVQTTNIISPAPLTQSSAVSDATCLLCNGSITVVGAGGTSPYSFLWNTGATTGTITGLCAGVYVDTVLDSKGCISVDTLGVSNSTGPVITLSKTDVACFGDCNGTANVSSVAGNGPPWNYSWFPGNQTTQLISGLCPFQYFATVTDINGCKTVDAVTIDQPAPLAPNAVVTNATCFGICNGSITANPAGGTGAYTYNWLPGGQTTSAIAAQCAGTYTLTLKDANNCSLTATITIGQNIVLSSAITSTNNSCNASCNGTASITVSGGTLPYTYAWLPGGQTTSSATGLCANNYTVAVNDAAGCIVTQTVSITEPGTLAANIAVVNPLCNGSCNGSVTSVPSGGTSPYTYLWMPNNLTTSFVTGLCAGTFTLTLNDANNCSVINTVPLADPAVLSSTYTVAKTSCANTCNGTIDITPSGGTLPYTFSWAPAGQTTEDATGLCFGDYSVTITDASSCAVTYTMNVGITTLVTAVAGNDTSFCTGGTASLTSLSVNAVSVGWYQLPAWSLVGSTITVNVSPPPGNTVYALIAVNGVCSDTDSVTVIVNNYPVVIINDTIVCSGITATLCASGAAAYQWYQLPVWAPVATGACITVSPPVGVTNYGIIGMNGVCVDTDSVAVTVLPVPVANAGNDISLCAGGSTVLCAKPVQAGYIFTWFILPAWNPIDTDTCTLVTPLITTDYGLIVSNGICKDSDTVAVTVYPSPIADAGTNVTILSTASTILNGTGGGAYNWSPAAGLNSTTIANPVAAPTTTTTYTLIVTDTSGCMAMDTVRVYIIPDVIPNDGLSPNGDGINDVWTIPYIEQFPNAVVEIYNRWGELLFHSIGYSKKWDATYNGKELPVGTYYYVINLNSDLHKDPITGPITILR